MADGIIERITMSDGADVGVYHVLPTGARRGGVVVVQEIFGVTDHIRDIADDYAADGYEVLAPALFDREHPGFEADYGGDGLARGMELARKLHPFDQSVKDVQSCIDMLSPKGPVFAVGFCYGGSVTWFAAARGEGLSAASAYYGSLIPASGLVPKVPVLAHFGRFDHGIPMEGVDALIAAAPANADIHVYEAGHGFNSDRRKDYHEPSADLAKARTLALFRANGG
jgi:carboxymethylenebutenolidase